MSYPMRRLFLSLFVFTLVLGSAYGQARLSVKVTEAASGAAIPGAAVVLVGTDPQIGAATDLDGRATLTAAPGSYNVKVSLIGFKPQVRFNVVLTTGNVQTLSFELEEEVTQTAEVEIVDDRRRLAAAAKPETPLSIQRLTTEEIKSNPGGNFDISRVIQVLPGVAGSTGGAGFRNDIIIRGGAPNENVFYLDGIEVPVINHFQTQGSSGGPAGIINVSFIEDVTLSTSAFPARYDNALASVFQFRQKEGNPERIQGNVRTSSSEVALTLEGPIDKKTTFLASARRSYFQYLFQLIDLPIRPNYWDFQTKITRKLSDKTSLSALGIGAIDEFSFAVPKNSTPDKEYAIRSSPTVNQWNYTVGAVLKHQLEDGYLQLALSRNTFFNKLDRFEDRRDDDPTARVLGIRSNETETKLRAEWNQSRNGWKLSAGVSAQWAEFTNNVYLVVRKQLNDTLGNLVQPGISVDTRTRLGFLKYGAFGQATRNFLDGRLGVSLGVRTDMNTFLDKGSNPLEAFSPRLSASYALSESWRINASVGRYTKLPIYTVLGYKDSAGRYVNKDNRYLTSDHFVAGLEYLPTQTTRVTVEGFYKIYGRYPYSQRDGISLANQGVQFDALGNERTIAEGKGRTYGIEVFFQQKLVKNWFATISYTYVISKFSGADGKLVASAWDNRNLVSALIGRKFRKGWELGVKYRLAGGSPYTPYDLEQSRLNYLSQGRGTLDYDALNTKRLRAFNQIDIRVDKKWNWKQFTLDLYLDLVNAAAFSNPAPDSYTFKRTADGKNYVTTDGKAIRPDGSNAIPLLLDNSSTLTTPTLGFIVEF